MSGEDQLASSIIEAEDDADVDLEVHYNHYGSRGVVDLVVAGVHEPSEERVEELTDEWRIPKGVARRKLTENWINVYELKSEAAIDAATGANEIVRQFNRHREYFFDGSKYNRRDFDTVSYFLTFVYSPSVYEHVSENAAIYSSLTRGDADVIVQYRHANGRQPIVAFKESGEPLPRETVEEVLGYPFKE